MSSLLYKSNISNLKKNIRPTKGLFSSNGQINSRQFMKRGKHNLVQSNILPKFKNGIRTFSTSNYSVPLTERIIFPEDEKREFMGAFPIVKKDLIEYVKRHDKCGGAEWFEKSLQYNVGYKLKDRGLLTVLTYKNLVGKSQLTPENVKLAHYLGWCAEMLLSCYNLMDDIVDESITRDGQPCWHTLDNVGMTAINDAFLIENGVYFILKKYFGEKDYYVKLIERIHRASFLFALGQISDFQMSKENVTTFTMEKYESFVLNKASQSSFVLPVAIGMDLAGITDPEIFRQVENVVVKMGHFFGVRNDFVDCYGNPEITGKVESDIQNNKCSWLAVTCMERASEAQKEIMRECYGKNDPEKVAQVKNLYMELGLPNAFETYKEDTFNRIKKLIQKIPVEVPLFEFCHNIFQKDM